MAKILLDYFFPIETITPTPDANTAFLKNVLAIVKPKVGATEDTPTLCTSKTAVDALSDTNAEVDQLFDAGLTRVWVMASDDLTSVGDDIEDYLAEFYTVLISSDFNDTEIDARVMGSFGGVIGIASTDDTKNATRAALANTCAFHSDSTNKAKNMFYAFGKMLSNQANWRNQQYISMPLGDDVTTVGDAQNLFDDRISFVLSDDEFGFRLGFFGCGGQAIVAPYIKKNLEIDFQSAALSYISGNQPQYTLKEAALIEDELQKVINEYIALQWIERGVAEVTLVQDNFVANAEMNVSEPKALWRIVGEIRQTL